MKKTLHSLAVLLVWCLALAGGREARASHAQAGELTYQYTGNPANPDRYLVRVKFFRDCSGIAAPTTFSLTCNNGSCNGAVVTATMNQVGQPVIGTPYCTAVQVLAVCPLTTSAPPSAPANYATYTYEATVNLPPANEWILGVEVSARPSVANLTSAGGTLRLEARLRNRITLPGGGFMTIQNNSPQFSTTNLPVPFVLLNKSNTVSFAASDIDRFNGGQPDILEYSLDQPLSGCGTFETYRPYPSGQCNPVVLSSNPPCVLNCPPTGPGNTYSATLPLPVGFDTVGTCPTKTVRSKFTFDPLRATFTFTPNRYLNTASSVGDNKYAVVGKVTEYRLINGVRYEIGSVRRDFLVIVIDGGGTPPPPPVGTPAQFVNYNITRDSSTVTVSTCNYGPVRLNFASLVPTTPGVARPNLTIFYPNDLDANILQNGDLGKFAVARQGQPNPTIAFYFQTTRFFNNTTLLIPLRIEDDGCPTKGVLYYNLRVKLLNDPRAARAVVTPRSGLVTDATNATICDGSSLNFRGSVARPDSVRNVNTGVVRLQTYTYQWSAISAAGTVTTTTPTPENGLPTVTNVSDIVVQPKRTTRYRLFINPASGFGPTSCSDTTSYVVRVAPTDSVDFRVTDIVSSRPKAGGGASNVLVPPITFKLQNTSFLSYAPGTTKLNTFDPMVGFRIDSVLWSYQRVKDDKGEPVTNSPVKVFSRQVIRSQGIPDTLSLTLGKNEGETGTYEIMLQSSVYQTVGVAAPTRLTCQTAAKIRTVVVPKVSTYNIITPNNDGFNDTFVVGPDLKGGTLIIYNRWGRKVEELSNYQSTWGAENQAPGVYYYMITDKAGASRKGWVEVVK